MGINSIQQLAFAGIMFTALLLLIAFLQNSLTECLLLDFPLNFYKIETIHVTKMKEDLEIVLDVLFLNMFLHFSLGSL